MKILCYGDSNTYGYDPRSFFGDRYDTHVRWVDRIAEKGKWTVLNWGENGQEIPSRPVKFPDSVDLLIIMLGTNDLLQGRDAQAVKTRMHRFLRQISYANVKILLVAPPALCRGQWVTDERVIHQAALVGSYFCDLAQEEEIFFVNADTWHIPLAFDGVHFTEEGHIIFADRLYLFLKEILINDNSECQIFL